jgi:hypothetical protein
MRTKETEMDWADLRPRKKNLYLITSTYLATQQLSLE